MRLPNASLTACSALLLAAVLCGCGGETNTSAEPRIEAATASDLADRSERVAELADQDECAAAHAADDLNAAARRAVDEGRVDQPLRRELLARAQELVDELNCPPAPPPSKDEDDGDDGDGEGNGKGKGKGKDKHKRNDKGDED